MEEKTIKDAIKEMMQIISKKIPDEHKRYPVDLFIAGGIAVNYYTASRMSKDIDAIISRRVEIPANLSVIWFNDKGEISELKYDHHYTPTLGIMHENYRSRAYLQYVIDDKLNVYVLSPEDLIISKLVRFGEQDQEDIKALIDNDLVDKKILEVLAKEAINDAIGVRVKTLELNLELTLEMFES